jgi:hypothetical protein
MHLDLGVRDQITWALVEAQGVGDREQIAGGVPQGSAGHALVGEVDEVTVAIFGQRAGALPPLGREVWEQVVGHRRTSSKGKRNGNGSTLA